MRNFQLLASGIEVSGILHQIQRQPELWDIDKIRTTYPNSPHNEAGDILIFFNDLNSIDVANDKEVIAFPAWQKLPALRPLIKGLLSQVDGVRLGRVMITRLGVGKQIYPHKDAGAPAEYYSRYQLMLQCLPGVVFKCGDENVGMQTGQLWWFDNTKEHSVINNSSDDRIVVIMDIRSE